MKKLMRVWEVLEKMRKEVPVREERTRMEGTYSGNPQQRSGQGGTGVGGGSQTIGDDGDAPAGARAAIGRDEPLVREVLGLVGVDYDALIAMDGKSPYSLAAAANPALIQDILTDERPVLAAVKVALGYKPVAEFQGKYGTTPEDIKAKIREEVLADMKGDPADAQPVVKAAVGPLFSHRAGGKRVQPMVKTDLASLFKK